MSIGFLDNGGDLKGHIDWAWWKIRNTVKRTLQVSALFEYVKLKWVDCHSGNELEKAIVEKERF